MTRSSTNELFTPYKEPEREFLSSRRHFKTLSLDELRSPDFNLLSDQEYLEEEEAEAMAETMDFELKGQFLKELGENTFSGLDNEDANEHIEKVLKIVDLFHVPNITVDQLMLRFFPISLTGAQEPDETLYQAWERFKELLMKCPQHYLTEMREEEIKKVNEKVYAAQVGCEQCKGPHYTKDCPLKEEGETLEEAYYMQFSGPFQGGGYSATTPGYYQRNNANPSYQERRQSMEDTLSKFMSESAKRHKENSNLIKEI
ncbi:NADH dehydrogenase subunit 6, mitochondrial [Tanacetum coccineum]